MRRAAVGLLLAAWLAVPTGAAAQTLLPLTPPLPDLARLVPFAEAPGEKPKLAGATLPLPPPPTDLPPFPLAAFAPPTADKPTAAVEQPGALACVGAFFGVASKALECGRARFAKSEYDDAAKALEQAARSGGDADLVLEARYWLAETYWVLGRVEQADRLFLQVVQTAPRGSDFALWATHGAAWTALRLGNAQRARDTFTQLLAGPMPLSMEPWVRHGLGLSSYALGRHQDAVAAWSALAAKGMPGARPGRSRGDRARAVRPGRPAPAPRSRPVEARLVEHPGRPVQGGRRRVSRVPHADVAGRRAQDRHRA